MFTIETYTGKFVDLLNFKSDVICLEDIAQSLSQTNRYAGHTIRPVSVAEHSLLVSYLVDAQFKKLGLVHDISECYYHDITTPLKKLIGPKYKELEEEAEKIITDKFGISLSPKAKLKVKEADTEAFLLEKTMFFKSASKKERLLAKKFVINNFKWYPGLSPIRAKKLFLDRWYEVGLPKCECKNCND